MRRIKKISGGMVCVFSIFAYQPAIAQKSEDSNSETYTAYVVRASDRSYQRVEALTVRRKDHAVQTRVPTRLGCDRVHSGKDRLWCFTRITPDKPRYYTDPTAYAYDSSSLAPSKPLFKVKGIVSRARISWDGRFGAGTAFTTGHSYLGVGGTNFSTMAFIVPLGSGGEPENLQNWEISHKGKQVTSIDLNVWGVTFDPKDSDHFFVTVYFDGQPYLAEGRFSSKKILVLQQGVECPSFSPDGKKIAYKSRTGPTRWSPAVLDVATGKSVIYEYVKDSVDDQIEWLDESTLIFQITDAPLVGSAQINLYTLDMRGVQPQPRLWLEDAKSPALASK